MPTDDEAFAFWPAITAHITLLQGIINRLATSSASCKTWCLSLVAAMVSLAGVTRTPQIVTMALVPVTIFGLIDSMYLAQERAYRDLYTKLVEKIHSRTYGLADTFVAKAPPASFAGIKAFFSWSIAPVYGGLAAVYLVLYCTGWLSLLARPVAAP